MRALTPQGLVRAMLSNNLKRGKQYEYISINWDGKNWIAWYQEIIDTTQLMAEAVNGAESGNSR